jgi:hypothetical protein
MLLDARKTEDPRSRLQKARRWELQQFAIANGMPTIVVDGEVLQFAKQNGLDELLPFAGKRINVDHPAAGAMVLRIALQQRGLTHIPVPNRPLGAQNQPHPRQMYQNKLTNGQSQPPAADVSDEAARAREYLERMGFKVTAADEPIKRESRRRVVARPRRLVERPRSEINKLRDECKALGIKMDRRDRMPDLKRKIAEHGQQDAAPGL